MTFFYDLNKRLAAVNDKPETQQLNERDNKEVDEGLGDMVKKVGGMVKKVGGAVLNKLGHGDDADVIRDLQIRMGLPPTGKKPEQEPEQKTTEAAKYRDPKYKDKLYTQEPPDHTYGPDMDDAYYNPKPDDYEGRKRKIGGTSGDPLTRGHRMSADNSINTHGKRKGLPSRDQITSLKGSIKDAHGTHAQPNLPEAGAPMSTKQKSFAALAPPVNKITFADKIAGAKKEVDEMLGDVAAEAMKSALGGGRSRGQGMEEAAGSIDYDKVLDAIAALYGDDIWENDAMQDLANDLEQAGPTDRELDFIIAKGKLPKRLAGIQFSAGDSVQFGEASQDNAFTAHKRPKEEPDMRTGERRKTHTGGAIEKTSDTSIRHHAGRNYSGEEDDEDTKKADKDDAMTRRASGEKAKLGRKEGSKKRIGAKINTGTSKLMTKEGDNEGGGNLKAAMALLKKAGYKVSKAKDEMDEGHYKDPDGDDESAEDQADQADNEKRSREEAGLDKGAKRRDPKNKKEVEETADNSPSKSSGGVSYGKGIYDSLNRDVENAITESMAQLNESLSINMSSSTEGGKSLTVTATEEDAMKLAVLLKMSGLGGGQGMEQSNQACPSCGSSSCNCDQMDEAYGDTVETQNSPDYPTNTETSGNAMQYSGGIDGPKSTGQATVPVLSSQEDRQATYEEDAALRRMMEMAGIQEAKKPDFLDMDKDGDKKEPMKKAIDDKDDKKVKESIFDLTNQWKTYKAR